MRAVIYARYSSDAQRDASIEDQLRLCKERLAREGWQLVQVFQDRALSGASSLRPGYQAMLTAAQEGSFEVVVAEALDRLSRDQEDVAGLFKRLRFAGIRIVTLAEGDINELHVGLKGTMNALFLKDLADKTRRGLRGRVEAGRSAGGLCYGYEVVRSIDAHGEPLRGERRIKDVEAAIVQQIFARFAAGDSPVSIAKCLNAKGVPGPQGRSWRDSTLRGHAARGTGVLRNELYAGRLVWNRQRFQKDPSTGRRVARPNPRSAWIIEQVPHLQIIDDALWDKAQARLSDAREKAGANAPDRIRWWEHRRPQHLLTGKCFCGTCGGALTNIGRDYLACQAGRRQGICPNRQSIRRDKVDRIVLDALRSRLMQPDMVAAFISAVTAEWDQLQSQRRTEGAGLRRELDSVNRKLEGLIDAVAEGIRSPSLQLTLDALEARRNALEADLAQSAADSPRLRLLPSLAELYRCKVTALQELLTGTDSVEALTALRGLIDRIVVTPVEAGAIEIDVTGEITALLALGQSGEAVADRDLLTCSMKVVAGTGFEPVTFRL